VIIIIINKVISKYIVPINLYFSNKNFSNKIILGHNSTESESAKVIAKTFIKSKSFANTNTSNTSNSVFRLKVAINADI